MGSYAPFPECIPLPWPGSLRITHPFATEQNTSTLFRSVPFDLHVLGMPPAFILSQDQTLHLILTQRLCVLFRYDFCLSIVSESTCFSIRIYCLSVEFSKNNQDQTLHLILTQRLCVLFRYDFCLSIVSESTCFSIRIYCLSVEFSKNNHL